MTTLTKLGLNVRNFGPAAAPEHFLSWARFAEDNGFALAMMSDHVALTPEVAAIYPAPFYDPFTTLAWMAGSTERLLLGTSVSILPYRNPLLTARMAANISRLSGGRFVLGAGVGWSREEYTALGVPFAERGRILDEYLTAIKAAWAEEVVSHDGHYATYGPVATGPLPERLPLWIGGSSPAAIRRTARFADSWHPINVPVGWLRETGLPALRAAAEELGRPVPEFAPRMRARLRPADVDETDRPAGVGSLRQILADIDALASLGATYVVLDTNADNPVEQPDGLDHDWRTLHTIAEQYLGR